MTVIGSIQWVVTPASTVLRAVTRVTILYAVDVGVHRYSCHITPYTTVADCAVSSLPTNIAADCVTACDVRSTLCMEQHKPHNGVCHGHRVRQSSSVVTRSQAVVMVCCGVITPCSRRAITGWYITGQSEAGHSRVPGWSQGSHMWPKGVHSMITDCDPVIAMTKHLWEQPPLG